MRFFGDDFWWNSSAAAARAVSGVRAVGWVGLEVWM